MTVILEDGKLTAYEQALPGPQDPVTISRGNVVNVIFKNRDPEKRRLTVNMGEFEEDINGTIVKQRPKVCTTLVREDGSQLLTFRLTKPSIASAEPYSFTVPGVAGRCDRDRGPLVMSGVDAASEYGAIRETANGHRPGRGRCSGTPRRLRP